MEINPRGDYLAVSSTNLVTALNWNANSDADLAAYHLHRNTTNAFGTSSLIATVFVTRFVDAAVTLNSSYFYWMRAVDRSGNLSPIHPGSTAGVAAAPLHIGTPEVGSNAITQIQEFANDGVSADITTEADISNGGVIITTGGGPILIIGKAKAKNAAASGATDTTLRVRRGTANSSPLVDEASARHPSIGDPYTLVCEKVDPQPAGTYTYTLRGLASGAGGHATFEFRRLQVVEIKR